MFAWLFSDPLPVGSRAPDFTLPDDADAKQVKAEFKDGVLTVHLPKSESAKPKQIEVKVE